METAEIKLDFDERDQLFKKEFTELKIKVVLNWFELFSLFLVALIISFEFFSEYVLKNILLTFVLSILFSVFISWIFCYFRKYRFNISRFDKEDIYKKISDDLIAQSKNED